MFACSTPELVPLFGECFVPLFCCRYGATIGLTACSLFTDEGMELIGLSACSVLNDDGMELHLGF